MPFSLASLGPTARGAHRRAAVTSRGPVPRISTLRRRPFEASAGDAQTLWRPRSIEHWTDVGLPFPRGRVVGGEQPSFVSIQGGYHAANSRTGPPRPGVPPPRALREGPTQTHRPRRPERIIRSSAGKGCSGDRSVGSQKIEAGARVARPSRQPGLQDVRTRVIRWKTRPDRRRSSGVRAPDLGPAP